MTEYIKLLWTIYRPRSIFIKSPTILKYKFSLYVGKYNIVFRVFKRGYMILMEGFYKQR